MPDVSIGVDPLVVNPVYRWQRFHPIRLPPEVNMFAPQGPALKN
jgi:hypothetical protein